MRRHRHQPGGWRGPLAASCAASLAAGIALTACAGGGSTSSDLQDACLSGPVRQVTERQFMAVPDFDSVKAGDPFRPEENDYDVIRIYNPEGYIVENIEMDMIGDTIAYHRVSYDSLGVHKVLEEHMDAKKRLCATTSYEYDEKGRNTRTLSRDTLNRTLWMETVEYADGGRTTRTYGPDGRLQMRVVEALDNDLPTDTKTFDANDNLTNHHRDKWQEGRRTGIIFYKDGQVDAKQQFSYDKAGNLTSQSGVDERGEKTQTMKYVYKYDKHGNWTSRAQYWDEKPYFVVMRDIEYYSGK